MNDSVSLNSEEEKSRTRGGSDGRSVVVVVKAVVLVVKAVVVVVKAVAVVVTAADSDVRVVLVFVA